MSCLENRSLKLFSIPQTQKGQRHSAPSPQVWKKRNYELGFNILRESDSCFHPHKLDDGPMIQQHGKRFISFIGLGIEALIVWIRLGRPLCTNMTRLAPNRCSAAEQATTYYMKTNYGRGVVVSSLRCLLT